MFKAIKGLIRDLSLLPSRFADVVNAIDGVTGALQEPVALRAYVDRLHAVEARLETIVGEAEDILTQANREKKQARNAEERTKSKLRRLEDAAETLEGYEPEPDEEPNYPVDVPPIDAPGSGTNGVSAMHSSMARRAEAKSRALSYKYRSA
jgi:chromosome segregation ATPase